MVSLQPSGHDVLLCQLDGDVFPFGQDALQASLGRFTLLWGRQSFSGRGQDWHGELPSGLIWLREGERARESEDGHALLSREHRARGVRPAVPQSLRRRNSVRAWSIRSGRSAGTLELTDTAYKTGISALPKARK